MARRGSGDKISLARAQKIALEAARVMPAEETPFFDALHRVLAEDVVSELDNPPFDRAMMDGFALIAEDTRGATGSSPVTLRIVGDIAIGSYPERTLHRGEAMRIMTGAPIPKGADAVLRVEYAKDEGGAVKVLEAISPGKDISPRGEDIKRGEVVLRQGHILGPGDIGVLAATGNLKVKVRKKPDVAVASTGSELLEPGERMRPGAIYDINTYTLSALLRGMGCNPLPQPIIRDDPAQLERLFDSDFDLLLLSGATSVGEKDFVPDVIERHGEILFHGVKMRPGSPAGFGFVEGRPVFMLPGFPVSAITAFELIVTPFIQRMLGTEISPPHHRVKGTLRQAVSSKKGALNFVRVRVLEADGRTLVEPVAVRGSSLITTLARADGFILVDEDVERIEAGEEVTVHLF